ncbi:vacuolar calcium ion transporter-like protein 1 [Elsinoe australis]|uniref:Vacuolar calcium ion transporter n=1 Tax=Elsinoe australis TaxID=40998 RepID=A0A4V6YAX4_9PEZI|nr:vacuolar calcium ion transporter-like protein 1 [Elsinoe australis]
MSSRPRSRQYDSPRSRYDSPRADAYYEERYMTEPKRAPGLAEKLHLPHITHNHNGHKVTPGIRAEGESGRRGVDPLHFFKITWKSSCTASKWVNVLWPFVPAAIVMHFVRPSEHLWTFVLSYIAMVPSANLLGFAGQELARKLPKVVGVVLETTLGSLVEIILFMVLLVTEKESGGQVIRAAILGSILANLLLCLGFCFFFGGMKRQEQEFHDAISEVGSNLMLVAGMALVIPTAYYTALQNRPDAGDLDTDVRRISRATAIVLLVAFCVYVYFQTSSHHGLYDDILELDDLRDQDRNKDLRKPKLTLTESIIALIFAVTFVSLMAVFLVQQIPYMTEEVGISDAFLGLILVPLVEKAAEHLTAIDEAWDNQMNYALSHVLGASIQTALLNTPLVTLVAWGLKINFTLDFELFDAVVLILAILVVGGFLRDGKSNYLEGALCVFVYVLIAIAAFFYPNPPGHGGEGH